MVSTIVGFTKALYQWVRPGLVAIFGRNIPFNIRWRLLLLQPFHFLGCMISGGPWLFSRPYTVEWITVSPGITLRMLIHKAKSKSKDGEKKLRPLHLNMHGGAFLGGLPEMDTPFCWKLAERTGAVVISATYRYAPEYTFPAAIDDVDAVVRYLQEHAEEKYGADPKLMTIGGFSAGGNLALAALQQENCHGKAPMAFKAALIYYGSIELRLGPGEKPKPLGFPAKDPFQFAYPLFDAYPAQARAKHWDDPRLSPVVAKAETLPDDIMLVIPTLDILLHEQLTFAKRIEEEARPGQKIVTKKFEKMLHGWDKLPLAVVGPTKFEAVDVGVGFLKEVYQKYSWKWD